MSEGLKPCPLCGSEWGWNISNEAPWHMPYVRCLGVGCNCAVHGKDRQQVIDRVNRRTPSPNTAKMVEILKEIVADGEWNAEATEVAREFIAENEPAARTPA